jgi:transposase InsO family protein
METVCQQFGITRQAHYQKLARELQSQKEGELILEMVRQVRRQHPQMGGRKLLYKIESMRSAEGLQIGRDRLFDLLRAANLLVKRKKSRRRTTLPGPWRTANLLPGLVISRPNQVWVCDITYLELERDRFAYLFLLMDLYSRYILGWHVASSLGAQGALASLKMALPYLTTEADRPIHHSDHGVQYTCHNYLNTLLDHEIRPSMGQVGNCYDNIFAERVIGTLKNEYRLGDRFVNLHQVQEAVPEVIYLYNADRPHLALQMAVPKQVYFSSDCHVPAVVIPQEVS